MAIKWVDRVPTYANRVRIVPEDGSAPYYATMERADQPTVVGTPINAANLNAMQEASGLTGYRIVYVSTTGSDATGTGSESAPYATITRALKDIPANLNGYTARVHIAAGTYVENVTIQNYGNGIIALTGTTGDKITIAGLVTITNVQLLQVFGISLNIQGSHLSIVASNVTVHTPFSASGDTYGVHATSLSRVSFSETVTINNTSGNAVASTNGSSLYVHHLMGSGNTNLFASTRGSICSFDSNTATGVANYYTDRGGRIFSGAQTQMPNY